MSLRPIPSLTARASLLLTAALACTPPAPATTTEASTDETGTSDPGTTGTTSAASDATATPTTTTDDAPTTSTPGTTDTSTAAPTTDPTDATTSTTEDPTAATTSTTDAVTATDTDETTSDLTTDTTDTTASTTGETTTDTSTTDAGTTDTTGAPDGLGDLAGDCGLIDAMELNSPSPFVFTSEIDFGIQGYDYDLLTPGGQQIYDEGNLNPGSLYSEIVAYEVLARCDAAILLKTEATIVYDNPMGKKTDLLVEMDGLKVGVSVVRAVGFPQDDPYTPAQADTIIKKKLEDILISSDNVAPEDQWVKQILSVVAYGPMHVESVLTAYEALPAATKADTILVVTATYGDDAFIY